MERNYSAVTRWWGDFISFLYPAFLWSLLWGQNGIILKLYRNIKSGFDPRIRRKRHLITWLEETTGRNIIDLNSVWKDGSYLCDVVNNSCPGAHTGSQHFADVPFQHGQNLVARYLRLQPAFAEADFLSLDLTPNLEKRLFRYLASVRHAVRRLQSSKLSIDEEHDNEIQIADEYVARGMGLITATKNHKSIFYIYSRDGSSLEDINIEIRGPRNDFGAIIVTGDKSASEEDSIAIPIDYRLTKEYVKVCYQPINTGYHELSLTKNGSTVPGSPFLITVDEITEAEMSRRKYNSVEWLTEEEEEERRQKLEQKKKNSKVLCRIVDFVTEKMYLTDDGKLVKIDGDVPITSTSFRVDNLLPPEVSTPICSPRRCIRSPRSRRKCTSPRPKIKRCEKRNTKLINTEKLKKLKSDKNIKTSDAALQVGLTFHPDLFHEKCAKIVTACDFLLKHAARHRSLEILSKAGNILDNFSLLTNNESAVDEDKDDVFLPGAGHNVNIKMDATQNHLFCSAMRDAGLNDMSSFLTENENKEESTTHERKPLTKQHSAKLARTSYKNEGNTKSPNKRESFSSISHKYSVNKVDSNLLTPPDDILTVSIETIVPRDSDTEIVKYSLDLNETDLSDSKGKNIITDRQLSISYQNLDTTKPDVRKEIYANSDNQMKGKNVETIIANFENSNCNSTTGGDIADNDMLQITDVDKQTEVDAVVKQDTITEKNNKYFISSSVDVSAGAHLSNKVKEEFENKEISEALPTIELKAEKVEQNNDTSLLAYTGVLHTTSGDAIKTFETSDRYNEEIPSDKTKAEMFPDTADVTRGKDTLSIPAGEENSSLQSVTPLQNITDSKSVMFNSNRQNSLKRYESFSNIVERCEKHSDRLIGEIKSVKEVHSEEDEICMMEIINRELKEENEEIEEILLVLNNQHILNSAIDSEENISASLSGEQDLVHNSTDFNDNSFNKNECTSTENHEINILLESNDTYINKRRFTEKYKFDPDSLEIENFPNSNKKNNTSESTKPKMDGIEEADNEPKLLKFTLFDSLTDSSTHEKFVLHENMDRSQSKSLLIKLDEDFAFDSATQSTPVIEELWLTTEDVCHADVPHDAAPSLTEERRKEKYLTLKNNINCVINENKSEECMGRVSVKTMRMKSEIFDEILGTEHSIAEELFRAEPAMVEELYRAEPAIVEELFRAIPAIVMPETVLSSVSFKRIEYKRLNRLSEPLGNKHISDSETQTATLNTSYSGNALNYSAAKQSGITDTTIKSEKNILGTQNLNIRRSTRAPLKSSVKHKVSIFEEKINTQKRNTYSELNEKNKTTSSANRREIIFPREETKCIPKINIFCTSHSPDDNVSERNNEVNETTKPEVGAIPDFHKDNTNLTCEDKLNNLFTRNAEQTTCRTKSAASDRETLSTVENDVSDRNNDKFNKLSTSAANFDQYSPGSVPYPIRSAKDNITLPENKTILREYGQNLNIGVPIEVSNLSESKSKCNYNRVSQIPSRITHGYTINPDICKTKLLTDLNNSVSKIKCRTCVDSSRYNPVVVKENENIAGKRTICTTENKTTYDKKMLQNTLPTTGPTVIKEHTDYIGEAKAKSITQATNDMEMATGQTNDIPTADYVKSKKLIIDKHILVEEMPPIKTNENGIINSSKNSAESAVDPENNNIFMFQIEYENEKQCEDLKTEITNYVKETLPIYCEPYSEKEDTVLTGTKNLSQKETVSVSDKNETNVYETKIKNTDEVTSEHIKSMKVTSEVYEHNNDTNVTAFVGTSSEAVKTYSETKNLSDHAESKILFNSKVQTHNSDVHKAIELNRTQSSQRKVDIEETEERMYSDCTINKISDVTSQGNEFLLAPLMQKCSVNSAIPPSSLHHLIPEGDNSTRTTKLDYTDEGHLNTEEATKDISIFSRKSFHSKDTSNFTDNILTDNRDKNIAAVKDYETCDCIGTNKINEDIFADSKTTTAKRHSLEQGLYEEMLNMTEETEKILLLNSENNASKHINTTTTTTNAEVSNTHVPPELNDIILTKDPKTVYIQLANSNFFINNEDGKTNYHKSNKTHLHNKNAQCSPKDQIETDKCNEELKTTITASPSKVAATLQNTTKNEAADKQIISMVNKDCKISKTDKIKDDSAVSDNEEDSSTTHSVTSGNILCTDNASQCLEKEPISDSRCVTDIQDYTQITPIINTEYNKTPIQNEINAEKYDKKCCKPYQDEETITHRSETSIGIHETMKLHDEEHSVSLCKDDTIPVTNQSDQQLAPEDCTTANQLKTNNSAKFEDSTISDYQLLCSKENESVHVIIKEEYCTEVNFKHYNGDDDKLSKCMNSNQINQSDLTPSNQLESKDFTTTTKEDKIFIKVENINISARDEKCCSTTKQDNPYNLIKNETINQELLFTAISIDGMVNTDDITPPIEENEDYTTAINRSLIRLTENVTCINEGQQIFNYFNSGECVTNTTKVEIGSAENEQCASMEVEECKTIVKSEVNTSLKLYDNEIIANNEDEKFLYTAVNEDKDKTITDKENGAFSILTNQENNINSNERLAHAMIDNKDYSTHKNEDQIISVEKAKCITVIEKENSLSFNELTIAEDKTEHVQENGNYTISVDRRVITSEQNEITVACRPTEQIDIESAILAHDNINSQSLNDENCTTDNNVHKINSLTDSQNGNTDVGGQCSRRAIMCIAQEGPKDSSVVDEETLIIIEHKTLASTAIGTSIQSKINQNELTFSSENEKIANEVNIPFINQENQTVSIKTDVDTIFSVGDNSLSMDKGQSISLTTEINLAADVRQNISIMNEDNLTSSDMLETYIMLNTKDRAINKKESPVSNETKISCIISDKQSTIAAKQEEVTVPTATTECILLGNKSNVTNLKCMDKAYVSIETEKTPVVSYEKSITAMSQDDFNTSTEVQNSLTVDEEETTTVTRSDVITDSDKPGTYCIPDTEGNIIAASGEEIIVLTNTETSQLADNEESTVVRSQDKLTNSTKNEIILREDDEENVMIIQDKNRALESHKEDYENSKTAINVDKFIDSAEMNTRFKTNDDDITAFMSHNQQIGSNKTVTDCITDNEERTVNVIKDLRDLNKTETSVTAVDKITVMAAEQERLGISPETDVSCTLNSVESNKIISQDELMISTKIELMSEVGNEENIISNQEKHTNSVHTKSCVTVASQEHVTTENQNKPTVTDNSGLQFVISDEKDETTTDKKLTDLIGTELECIITNEENVETKNQAQLTVSSNSEPMFIVANEDIITHKKQFTMSTESEHKHFIADVKNVNEGKLTISSATEMDLPRSYKKNISVLNQDMIVASINEISTIIDVKDTIMTENQNKPRQRKYNNESVPPINQNEYKSLRKMDTTLITTQEQYVIAKHQDELSDTFESKESLSVDIIENLMPTNQHNTHISTKTKISSPLDDTECMAAENKDALMVSIKTEANHIVTNKSIVDTIQNKSLVFPQSETSDVANIEIKNKEEYIGSIKNTAGLLTDNIEKTVVKGNTFKDSDEEIIKITSQDTVLEQYETNLTLTNKNTVAVTQEKTAKHTKTKKDHRVDDDHKLPFSTETEVRFPQNDEEKTMAKIQDEFTASAQTETDHTQDNEENINGTSQSELASLPQTVTNLTEHSRESTMSTNQEHHVSIETESECTGNANKTTMTKFQDQLVALTQTEAELLGDNKDNVKPLSHYKLTETSFLTDSREYTISTNQELPVSAEVNTEIITNDQEKNISKILNEHTLPPQTKIEHTEEGEIIVPKNQYDLTAATYSETDIVADILESIVSTNQEEFHVSHEINKEVIQNDADRTISNTHDELIISAKTAIELISGNDNTETKSQYELTVPNNSKTNLKVGNEESNLLTNQEETLISSELNIEFTGSYEKITTDKIYNELNISSHNEIAEDTADKNFVLTENSSHEKNKISVHDSEHFQLINSYSDTSTGTKESVPTLEQIQTVQENSDEHEITKLQHKQFTYAVDEKLIASLQPVSINMTDIKFDDSTILHDKNNSTVFGKPTELMHNADTSYVVNTNQSVTYNKSTENELAMTEEYIDITHTNEERKITTASTETHKIQICLLDQVLDNKDKTLSLEIETSEYTLAENKLSTTESINGTAEYHTYSDTQNNTDYSTVIEGSTVTNTNKLSISEKLTMKTECQKVIPECKEPTSDETLSSYKFVKSTAQNNLERLHSEDGSMSSIKENISIDFTTKVNNIMYPEQYQLINKTMHDIKLKGSDGFNENIEEKTNIHFDSDVKLKEIHIACETKNETTVTETSTIYDPASLADFGQSKLTTTKNAPITNNDVLPDVIAETRVKTIEYQDSYTDECLPEIFSRNTHTNYHVLDSMYKADKTNNAYEDTHHATKLNNNDELYSTNSKSYIKDILTEFKNDIPCNQVEKAENRFDCNVKLEVPNIINKNTEVSNTLSYQIQHCENKTNNDRYKLTDNRSKQNLPCDVSCKKMTHETHDKNLESVMVNIDSSMGSDIIPEVIPDDSSKCADCYIKCSPDAKIADNQLASLNKNTSSEKSRIKKRIKKFEELCSHKQPVEIDLTQNTMKSPKFNRLINTLHNTVNETLPECATNSYILPNIKGTEELEILTLYSKNNASEKISITQNSENTKTEINKALLEGNNIIVSDSQMDTSDLNSKSCYTHNDYNNMPTLKDERPILQEDKYKTKSDTAVVNQNSLDQENVTDKSDIEYIHLEPKNVLTDNVTTIPCQTKVSDKTENENSMPNKTGNKTLLEHKSGKSTMNSHSELGRVETEIISDEEKHENYNKKNNFYSESLHQSYKLDSDKNEVSPTQNDTDNLYTLNYSTLTHLTISNSESTEKEMDVISLSAEKESVKETQYSQGEFAEGNDSSINENKTHRNLEIKEPNTATQITVLNIGKFNYTSPSDLHAVTKQSVTEGSMEQHETEPTSRASESQSIENQNIAFQPCNISKSGGVQDYILYNEHDTEDEKQPESNDGNRAFTVTTKLINTEHHTQDIAQIKPTPPVNIDFLLVQNENELFNHEQAPLSNANTQESIRKNKCGEKLICLPSMNRSIGNFKVSDICLSKDAEITEHEKHNIYKQSNCNVISFSSTENITEENTVTAENIFINYQTKNVPDLKIACCTSLQSHTDNEDKFTINQTLSVKSETGNLLNEINLKQSIHNNENNRDSHDSMLLTSEKNLLQIHSELNENILSPSCLENVALHELHIMSEHDGIFGKDILEEHVQLEQNRLESQSEENVLQDDTELNKKATSLLYTNLLENQIKMPENEQSNLLFTKTELDHGTSVIKNEFISSISDEDISNKFLEDISPQLKENSSNKIELICSGSCKVTSQNQKLSDTIEIKSISIDAEYESELESNQLEIISQSEEIILNSEQELFKHELQPPCTKHGDSEHQIILEKVKFISENNLPQTQLTIAKKETDISEFTTTYQDISEINKIKLKPSQSEENIILGSNVQSTEYASTASEFQEIISQNQIILKKYEYNNEHVLPDVTDKNENINPEFEEGSWSTENSIIENLSLHMTENASQNKMELSKHNEYVDSHIHENYHIQEPSRTDENCSVLGTESHFTSQVLNIHPISYEKENTNSDKNITIHQNKPLPKLEETNVCNLKCDLNLLESKDNTFHSQLNTKNILKETVLTHVNECSNCVYTTTKLGEKLEFSKNETSSSENTLPNKIKLFNDFSPLNVEGNLLPSEFLNKNNVTLYSEENLLQKNFEPQKYGPTDFEVQQEIFCDKSEIHKEETSASSYCKNTVQNRNIASEYKTDSPVEENFLHNNIITDKREYHLLHIQENVLLNQLQCEIQTEKNIQQNGPEGCNKYVKNDADKILKSACFDKKNMLTCFEENHKTAFTDNVSVHSSLTVDNNDCSARIATLMSETDFDLLNNSLNKTDCNTSYKINLSHNEHENITNKTLYKRKDNIDSKSNLNDGLTFDLIHVTQVINSNAEKHHNQNYLSDTTNQSDEIENIEHQELDSRILEELSIIDSEEINSNMLLTKSILERSAIIENELINIENEVLDNSVQEELQLIENEIQEEISLNNTDQLQLLSNNKPTENKNKTHVNTCEELFTANNLEPQIDSTLVGENKIKKLLTEESFDEEILKELEEIDKENNKEDYNDLVSSQNVITELCIISSPSKKSLLDQEILKTPSCIEINDDLPQEQLQLTKSSDKMDSELQKYEKQSVTQKKLISLINSETFDIENACVFTEDNKHTKYFVQERKQMHLLTRGDTFDIPTQLHISSYETEALPNKNASRIEEHDENNIIQKSVSLTKGETFDIDNKIDICYIKKNYTEQNSSSKQPTITFCTNNTQNENCIHSTQVESETTVSEECLKNNVANCKENVSLIAEYNEDTIRITSTKQIPEEDHMLTDDGNQYILMTESLPNLKDNEPTVNKIFISQDSSYIYAETWEEDCIYIPRVNTLQNTSFPVTNSLETHTHTCLSDRDEMRSSNEHNETCEEENADKQDSTLSNVTMHSVSELEDIMLGNKENSSAEDCSSKEQTDENSWLPQEVSYISSSSSTETTINDINSGFIFPDMNNYEFFKSNRNINASLFKPIQYSYSTSEDFSDEYNLSSMEEKDEVENSSLVTIDNTINNTDNFVLPGVHNSLFNKHEESLQLFNNNISSDCGEYLPDDNGFIKTDDIEFNLWSSDTEFGSSAAIENLYLNDDIDFDSIISAPNLNEALKTLEKHLERKKDKKCLTINDEMQSHVMQSFHETGRKKHESYCDSRNNKDTELEFSDINVKMENVTVSKSLFESEFLNNDEDVQMSVHWKEIDAWNPVICTSRYPRVLSPNQSIMSVIEENDEDQTITSSQTLNTSENLESGEYSLNSINSIIAENTSNDLKITELLDNETLDVLQESVTLHSFDTDKGSTLEDLIGSDNTTETVISKYQTYHIFEKSELLNNDGQPHCEYKKAENLSITQSTSSGQLEIMLQHTDNTINSTGVSDCPENNSVEYKYVVNDKNIESNSEMYNISGNIYFELDKSKECYDSGITFIETDTLLFSDSVTCNFSKDVKTEMQDENNQGIITVSESLTCSNTEFSTHFKLQPIDESEGNSRNTNDYFNHKHINEKLVSREGNVSLTTADTVSECCVIKQQEVIQYTYDTPDNCENHFLETLTPSDYSSTEYEESTDTRDRHREDKLPEIIVISSSPVSFDSNFNDEETGIYKQLKFIEGSIECVDDTIIKISNSDNGVNISMSETEKNSSVYRYEEQDEPSMMEETDENNETVEGVNIIYTEKITNNSNTLQNDGSFTDVNKQATDNLIIEMYESFTENVAQKTSNPYEDKLKTSESPDDVNITVECSENTISKNTNEFKGKKSFENEVSIKTESKDCTFTSVKLEKIEEDMKPTSTLVTQWKNYWDQFISENNKETEIKKSPKKKTYLHKTPEISSKKYSSIEMNKQKNKCDIENRDNEKIAKHTEKQLHIVKSSIHENITSRSPSKYSEHITDKKNVSIDDTVEVEKTKLVSQWKNYWDDKITNSTNSSECKTPTRQFKPLQNSQRVDNKDGKVMEENSDVRKISYKKEIPVTNEVTQIHEKTCEPKVKLNIQVTERVKLFENTTNNDNVILKCNKKQSKINKNKICNSEIESCIKSHDQLLKNNETECIQEQINEEKECIQDKNSEICSDLLTLPMGRPRSYSTGHIETLPKFSGIGKCIERKLSLDKEETSSLPYKVDCKIQFEKAKNFFKHLENNNPSEIKNKNFHSLPKMDLSKKSSKQSFDSDSGPEARPPRKRERFRGRRRKKKEMIRVRSAPTSDTESVKRTEENKYLKPVFGGSEKSKKVSERFHVKDLFRDVSGDSDGFFRGIPHREAVLASLRSVNDLRAVSPSPYESDMFQLRSAKSISNIPTGYQEEYPYLPTTPVSMYRPRSALEFHLISRSELLELDT